ncbi:MAG: hypothetical protein FWF36_09345 [Propionibacteriaceae bacterium]|nr:hypothetical protein [Propionibacteriaceae bacterium]
MANEIIAVGLDGDAWSSDLPDPGLVAQFDDIRGTIDALVEPFGFMPGQSNFDAYMDDLGYVLVKLGTSEEGGGGTDLNSYIIQMMNAVNDMNGDFIWAFKHFFVNMFEAAVARYYGLGVILGAALGGEKGLWVQTQKAVDEAVDRAAEAFEARSVESESAWDELAKIVHVMADGLDLFAASAELGGQVEAALPLEAIAAGLNLIADIIPEDDDPKPANTYLSLMDSFSATIAKIKDDGVTQENVLKDNLQSSFEATFGNQWAFATPFAGQPIDQSSSWDEVLIDPEKCSQLCEGSHAVLPGIVGVLDEVHRYVELMTDSTSWYRDEAFGSGEKGCWASWDTLRCRMSDFLDDLRWKTEKASEVFKDVIRAFKDGDRDAAANLAKLEAELNHGPGAQTDWPDHVHTEGGIGGY